jgi:hypothetical protein
MLEALKFTCVLPKWVVRRRIRNLLGSPIDYLAYSSSMDQLAHLPVRQWIRGADRQQFHAEGYMVITRRGSCKHHRQRSS